MYDWVSFRHTHTRTHLTRHYTLDHTKYTSFSRSRVPAPVFLFYVNKDFDMIGANHFAITKKRSCATVYKTLICYVTENESL